MLRRRFLTQSFVTSAALAAPSVWAQGTPKLTPIRFTLDFRITGQTSPFYLAQQRGYYAAEGLDVSIDVGSGSVGAITRILSGAYQMGLGDISSLIEFQAANGGTPAVQAVYQYYNRAPFAIIGRKDRGITNDFNSLRGKKVAAAAVEATRRAWPMVARRLRVGDDFFQWTTTDFSARDNVMVRGDVDAATYFHDSAVSLFARLKTDELSVLKYTDAGVNLYGNAILAGNALITQNPAAVKGFLRATNRGIQESFLDPVAAIAATKQREPMINEAVEAERWRITREYVAAPDTRGHGLGDVLKRTLEQQVEQVSEVYQLKLRPSADGVFHRGFLPSLDERTLKA